MQPAPATEIQGDLEIWLGDDGVPCARTVPPVSRQQAALASREFGPAAAELAARVLPGQAQPKPFTPKPPVTSFAHWFEDAAGQRLVAVVPPVVGRGVLTVLAHGLAWQGDRDLILVVPANRAAEVTDRTIWLDTPVRVWSYTDPGAQPIQRALPTRAEVTGRAPESDWSAHTIPADRRAWISEIEARLAALVSPDQVVVHDQASYVTWQADGMELFHASAPKSARSLTVRVDFPKRDGGGNLELRLTGPATAGEIDRLLAAVRRRRIALANTQIAAQNPEHKLQAALPACADRLGLTAMIREYPAHRPGGGTGFIDFLGLDTAGHLHIVETKIGHDPKVVLQGLDYLTWVIGREAEVRSDPRWHDPIHWAGVPADIDPEPRKIVHVDFVLAGKTGHPVAPAVNTYLAGQLEALHHDVSWRLWTTSTDNPADLVLRADTRSVADLWTPVDGVIRAPVRDQRWAGRVASALSERP